MRRPRKRAAIWALGAALVLAGVPAATALDGPRPVGTMAAVKGFDEAGVSTGTGDSFTMADNPADVIDLESVSAAWRAGLTHRA